MNWARTEYPVAPWDSPGLPQRLMNERCARHLHCAYRDDDPARCELCHRLLQPGVGCGHGGPPFTGYSGGGLRKDQHADPRIEAKIRSDGQSGPARST